MLLEMAVADAFSIPFEFCNNAGRETAMTQYYQHPHYDDMTPGHYTDDTQRSLANATVVIGSVEIKSEIYNPVTYIEALFKTFRSDPRPGYSKKFEAFLRENLRETSVDVFHKIKRRGSNGSVMGAAVLGYLDTPEMVMNAAAAQAYSTHAYTTIPCAQIVALSAHFFIEKIGPKAELLDFLIHHLGDEILSAILVKAPMGKVDMSAEAVTGLMLNTIPHESSLTRLIEIAVERGGDTDSSAAVMVAIASCSEEYRHDIPQVLFDNLERGWYGFEHLASMDNLLARIRATKAESDLLMWEHDTQIYSSISSIRNNSYYKAFRSRHDISPVTDRVSRGEIGISYLIALKDHFGDDGPNIDPADLGGIQKCCAIWREWLAQPRG